MKNPITTDIALDRFKQNIKHFPNLEKYVSSSLIQRFQTEQWYENRVIGDSNDDGRFDSSDLVKVFQTAHYEDGVPNNSTFDEGDWNQDGEFDSRDLVFAFQAGNYQVAAAIDWLFAKKDTP